MNKIIMEKIPLEERLRSVYLPIIIMDCACYLSEDLLTVLRTLRLNDTKKTSRVIRSCVEGYRSDNYYVMPQICIMSDLLGKNINYTTEDNHYCLERIKALNGLFSVLKVPDYLSTNQTAMAFSLFKNKLNSVKIWFIR